jgi:hypothetical protein
MGFLCRHCGNTFERLERMEMHSERCWKADKANTLEELASIEEIKEVGNDFYAMLHSLGDSREIEMAKLKLEECVMWAVKGICNND